MGWGGRAPTAPPTALVADEGGDHHTVPVGHHYRPQLEDSGLNLRPKVEAILHLPWCDAALFHPLGCVFGVVEPSYLHGARAGVDCCCCW